MKLVRAFAFAAVASASLSAIAATDGVANATQSVATYTNTFGNTPVPTIRVFGVDDAAMLPSSGNVPSFFGPFPGIEDSFCVAHSTGGSVTIRFTSPGITAGTGNDIIATSTATGAKVAYHQSVALAGTDSFELITSAANSLTVTEAQTDMVNCATPNVRKTIIRSLGLQSPSSDIFTDTVTITATLN